MHRFEKIVNSIIDVNWLFAEVSVVATAIELNIFAVIKKGYKRCEEIAKKTKSDTRIIESLLNTLVGMKLLSKSKEGYDLTSFSEKNLIKESGIRSAIKNIILWRTLWLHLKDVVRKGRPYQIEEFRRIHTPSLIRRIFTKHYRDAKHIANVLGVGERWRGLYILDIGTGLAPWSIAMAEKDRLSRVTAVDFQKFLSLTKEYVKNHRLEKQFSYLPGNIRRSSFGANQYDLVILGHICHSEGARSTKRLIRRVYRALRSRGKILIADHIPSNQRTSPLFPLIFDLWEKIISEEGGTFTMADYTAWLKKAGFSDIKTIKIPSGDSPVIVATKIAPALSTLTDFYMVNL